MSEPSGDVDLDLSGQWSGLYSYPPGRGREPVAFTATLKETDGWLEGSTTEVGQVGAARGLTISATLQGRRSGRSVTFLKTYDGSFRSYDAVQYVGDVRDDGCEIEGRWTIQGNWSGTFLMIRSGHPYEFAREREVVKIGRRR
jgi:hypothetical protein